MGPSILEFAWKFNPVDPEFEILIYCKEELYGDIDLLTLKEVIILSVVKEGDEPEDI